MSTSISSHPLVNLKSATLWSEAGASEAPDRALKRATPSPVVNLKRATLWSEAGASEAMNRAFAELGNEARLQPAAKPRADAGLDKATNETSLGGSDPSREVQQCRFMPGERA